MGLLSDNAITELVQWAINKFSLSKHSHETSDVTGLNEALNGKAAANHNHTKSQITDFPTIPTKTSELENDSNFVTDISGLQVTVDSALSETSVNPVQNKVVKAALDGKANSTHTHTYAGASTSGGSATSAAKLDTATAGSATQPCYFTGGKPAACTYTLAKSVPSNAVFTDTVYTHPTTAGNKHIPAGGSQFQFLKWSADGTAVWEANAICGTFTGTGATQKIDIGVTPKAVIVQTQIGGGEAEVAVVKYPSKQADGTVRLEIVTHGFNAGYGIQKTGTVYCYIAIM